jgi:soluble lytic murein transglycosylase-like protein
MRRVVFLLLALVACGEPEQEPAPVAPIPVPVAVAPTRSNIPSAALKYRADLTREAHFTLGLRAPIDYLAGQIHQESGWRPGVTAFDNGRGLAQFMDGTAKWVAERYPDLGTPQPYDPLWAIRAMVRLDGYNIGKVAADGDCDRWGAALKAYNAGLGFVQRAQKKSETPVRWFGATENINAGQSIKNFEASRMYPRWIIFKHAPIYAAWGRAVDCGGRA